MADILAFNALYLGKKAWLPHSKQSKQSEFNGLSMCRENDVHGKKISLVRGC